MRPVTDAPTAEVVAQGGAALVTGLAYKQASAIKEVGAGVHALELKLAGQAQAALTANAKLLAQDIANRLTAAQAKRQYTVEVTISMSYRSAQDLGEIFDRIENIVRQIVAVLPGGAKDVNEVIISLPRASKSDKYPARRVVKLHGGS